MKFQGGRHNPEGKFEEMPGQKMMDINFGDSMLCLSNDKKRTGINPKTDKEFRDPDYNILAYPEEAKTEKTEGVEEEEHSDKAFGED